MLSLTRERDQVIELQDAATGDLIGKIEVTSVLGGKVKLGFLFPKSITIHRQEVAEQIRAEAARVAVKGKV